MKRILLTAILGVALILGVCTAARAVDVTIPFAFTPSVSTDVVGYTLYARPENGSYGPQDMQWYVDNLVCDAVADECTFDQDVDLPYGTYVFSLAAFSCPGGSGTQCLWSVKSNETDPFEIYEEPPPVIAPEPPTSFKTLMDRIMAFIRNFFNRSRGFRRG